MNTQSIVFSLYEAMVRTGDSDMASGNNHPERVFEHLRSDLQRLDVVTVDLARMRSLSPSFAYEAFGKLVDTYGKDVRSRLNFINDPLNLKSRIFAAIDRRSQVIK